MFKVLVTHPNVPKEGLDLLKKSCELVFLKGSTQSDFLNQIRDVDGVFLFAGQFKIGKEFVEKSSGRVKVVAQMGVGVDHIDVDYVKSKGIKLSNVPGTLSACVSEITLALSLNVAHRTKEGFNKIISGKWEKGEPQWLLGQEIRGSTYGIIGLGSIGKAIAKRVFAFEPKKILYSGRSEKPYAKEFGAEFVPLDTLLKTSDFIVLACPLTEETKHLINKKAIEKMKQNAILINIGRGELVQQDDLYEALKNKRIMGAGLDVMTPEPLNPSDPLIQLENCILTPHIGSATYQTRSAMSVLAAENILAALEGKEMPTPL